MKAHGSPPVRGPGRSSGRSVRRQARFRQAELTWRPAILYLRGMGKSAGAAASPGRAGANERRTGAERTARRAAPRRSPTSHPTWLRRSVLSSALLAASGCGAAAPLLYPATPLADGMVAGGAGLSTSIPTRAGVRALDASRAASASELASEADEIAFAKGVIARALAAPGASPWLSARVGLPGSSEAGITYAGRVLRVDGRKVFGSGPIAVSLGLGISGLVSGPDESPGNREPDQPTIRGAGAELPVRAGYQVAGGFVAAWLGGRAGLDRVRGEIALPVADIDGSSPAAAVDLRADRWWLAPEAGVSIGPPPLSLRIGITAVYSSLRGRFEPTDGREDGRSLPRVSLSVWNVQPSAALVGGF